MTYEFEGKNEKEAIEKAVAELGLERDQFDVEIIETQKKSLFKAGYVKIRVHTVSDTTVSKSSESVENTRRSYANPLAQDEFEQKLLDFGSETITKMGYEVTVEIAFREEHKVGIKLTSSSSCILIGRKGTNFHAIRLLANVYPGHLGREYVRVVLDTENYRVRREENLVHLAYNTADRVRSSRQSILLEPMNPFERRLIHTTLNDIPDVETISEGEGLYKQVRVIYKGSGF